ncbi:hypothetical protein PoB_002998200 [Plakobranchus ocellatus]|uniref:STI1/HOP DP domain-containing protein n=1 Tax=Plakobranchus ocellatus TaxID=259542 RepID=A0AAV4A999_9GAST|nr:hypothetical protein PoB_002998200 [Plakobranchus ocellatus]
MADNPDVPPLEDMTDLLKKADKIRESRHGPSKPSVVPKAEKSVAKERAKVVKKPAARVVTPNDLGKGDGVSAASQSEQAKSSAPPPVAKSAKPAVYAGLKKGFLFGGSGGSYKSVSTPPVTNSKPAKDGAVKPKEDIPYISPKAGNSQSELTFDEVQQAMSEAKGLLENQDWITDDLLTKIEKNETLRKRFADPRFMQALEEFQKDPTAAMAKYKGNQEVETFLQQFCGLLGDHFTSLGDSSSQQNSNSKASASTSSQPHRQPQAAPFRAAATPSTPKITEILDNETKLNNSSSPNTSSKSPKIIELTDENSVPSGGKSKASSNVVDLTEDSPSLSKLKIGKDPPQPRSGGGGGGGGGRVPDIMTYTPGAGADIQEAPAAPFMPDDEVKEILKDQKVMETLMDPHIMNIIQLLRTDPEKAQRIVDGAKGDLKEKITLLILKGLLRFQAS